MRQGIERFKSEREIRHQLGTASYQARNIRNIYLPKSKLLDNTGYEQLSFHYHSHNNNIEIIALYTQLENIGVTLTEKDKRVKNSAEAQFQKWDEKNIIKLYKDAYKEECKKEPYIRHRIGIWLGLRKDTQKTLKQASGLTAIEMKKFNARLQADNDRILREIDKLEKFGTIDQIMIDIRAELKLEIQELKSVVSGLKQADRSVAPSGFSGMMRRMSSSSLFGGHSGRDSTSSVMSNEDFARLELDDEGIASVAASKFSDRRSPVYEDEIDDGIDLRSAPVTPDRPKRRPAFTRVARTLNFSGASVADSGAGESSMVSVMSYGQT